MSHILAKSLLTALCRQMTIRVSLREMPSFTQHQRAPHMFRDFIAGSAVGSISLATCGSLISVTARLPSGQCKVLLFNWKTFASSVSVSLTPKLTTQLTAHCIHI